MRPMTNRHTRSGFTLLEALAASVILGAAVVALSGVSTRCMSQTKLNRQYELAWELLDRQLITIGALGIDTFVAEGQLEGDFPETEPGCYWLAGITEQSEDNLYLVTLVVYWTEQGKVHQVSAATMFNGN